MRRGGPGESGRPDALDPQPSPPPRRDLGELMVEEPPHALLVALARWLAPRGHIVFAEIASDLLDGRLMLHGVGAPAGEQPSKPHPPFHFGASSDGSGLSLPLRDKGCDLLALVLSGAVGEHAGSSRGREDELLREARRALTPQGALVVLQPDSPRPALPTDRVRRHFPYVWEATVEVGPSARAVFRAGPVRANQRLSFGLAAGRSSAKGWLLSLASSRMRRVPTEILLWWPPLPMRDVEEMPSSQEAGRSSSHGPGHGREAAAEASGEPGRGLAVGIGRGSVSVSGPLGGADSRRGSVSVSGPLGGADSRRGSVSVLARGAGPRRDVGGEPWRRGPQASDVSGRMAGGELAARIAELEGLHRRVSGELRRAVSERDEAVEALGELRRAVSERDTLVERLRGLEDSCRELVRERDEALRRLDASEGERRELLDELSEARRAAVEARARMKAAETAAQLAETRRVEAEERCLDLEEIAARARQGERDAEDRLAAAHRDLDSVIDRLAGCRAELAKLGDELASQSSRLAEELEARADLVEEREHLMARLNDLEEQRRVYWNVASKLRDVMGERAYLFFSTLHLCDIAARALSSHEAELAEADGVCEGGNEGWGEGETPDDDH